MLELRAITKDYTAGGATVHALQGVDLKFRRSEFVSILGPSGCGKTTLLNIIGGLDRYDSGDLLIRGRSTREFKARDWDNYRNHTIGFVFQSYNLIPHQSVLANVELALTLSGVSRKERRERAVRALERVGLGEQLHKRPNQMSGGQMQRVAIARALVNDPDILLADEPTGALDSDTSLQIMELLKEIAQDKLVIMVTHNPELADRYSTRVIRMLDGRITGDSLPPEEAEAVPEAPAEKKKGKKASMSFLTALSLSFNNLRTKKGRTILTSFAGSIGIIGIALILALSTGMNTYIASIQRETMAAYPVTINATAFDASVFTGLRSQLSGRSGTGAEERAGIYADYRGIKASEAVVSGVTQNNLTAFKRYLDDPGSEIRQYLGENGVVYGYDVSFRVYSHDPEGVLVDSDSDPVEKASQTASGFMGGFAGMMSDTGTGRNFSQMMAGAGGEAISQVVTDNYDLLYGAWPVRYDQVLLVLDEDNSLPAETLYQLGLITAGDYRGIVDVIKEGGEAGELRFDYADACGHPFYLVAACDHYVQNEDGTFSPVETGILNQDALLQNAVELQVTGVVRPASNSSNASITTPVAYTGALTDYMITHTAQSPVVTAQEAAPQVNVLNGLKFDPASDEEKVTMAVQYAGAMGISDKASLYQLILFYNATNAPEDGEQPADSPAAGAAGQGQGGAPVQMDEAALAMLMDRWLADDPDPDIMLSLYDQYIGDASYQDNMTAFGAVSYDAPASISIYADDFEAKEAIAACIQAYNDSVDEANRISYTDYVAMMTSSLTTIINGISYILIAFVAISLIVSCIMIGIITHISVLERTKEIGILRALGASKRNISQVFNAETVIIGFTAGLLGVVVSGVLCMGINRIIHFVTGSKAISAALPLPAAILLIVISMALTLISGIIPSRGAAKKDPVIALRTE